MLFEDAQQLIRRQLSEMNKAYGATLFDEFAILRIKGGKPMQLLGYEGPRAKEINDAWPDDLKMLSPELREAGRISGGEFGFIRIGAGSYFDAFIGIGQDMVLLLNHTSKSIEELTANSRWLQAQAEFLKLSHVFGDTPAEMP